MPFKLGSEMAATEFDYFCFDCDSNPFADFVESKFRKLDRFCFAGEIRSSFLKLFARFVLRPVYTIFLAVRRHTAWVKNCLPIR
jgi:hypothetical protein